MAIKNGSDLILKVSSSSGGTENKLMHATSCTLDIAMETIDITTKDSSGYRELLGGLKSFTLSADGLMDFNSSATDTEVDELFNQLDGRTEVDFTFTLATTASGDYTFTGDGFITALSVTGGTEDAPTYSVTIEGTGALTKNDIA